MSGKTYCVVSGSVFLIIALMQFWRFVLDSPVQIGVWNVPRSLSLCAAILAVGMAIWAFRSARGPKSPQTVYS